MISRLFLAGLSLLLGALATSAAASQDDRVCPKLTENAEAAQHWSIVMDSDEGMLRATIRTAAKPTFWLEFDGLVEPTILDWYFPQPFAGRIGVLHYESGAAGTHASTSFTRVAVIDLLTGALIANPLFSVETSGARYTENTDGTTTETVYYYCDLGEFEWMPDRFIYTYENEITSYTLSGSGRY